MPATKAQLKYGLPLDIHHPSNPYTDPTLLFNDEGLIDIFIFDAINQQLSHSDPANEGGRTYQQQIDFNLINNAIILYVIAQREGKIVARDEFNNEALLKVIQKYISPRISNPSDVAKEIYDSWLELQDQQKFIRNVTEGRVKVEKSEKLRYIVQPLKEIPNFESFLNGLINCYLNTVANERNIQSWSLQQSLQLFLSTKAGHAFNQKRAETLVKAANVIEQNKKAVVEKHKSSPDQEKAAAKKLNDLQEMLMQEAGMWLGTLKSLIEGDITNAFEDLKANEIENFKSALNNLLAEKYDKCSDIPAINELFELIKTYLTADENSQFYKSTINRDGANKPSLELFRAGIRLAIRRAANEHKIELNSEPVFEEKVAQVSSAAVPAAAGKSAIDLSPISSQPAIASAQLIPSQEDVHQKYMESLKREIKKLYKLRLQAGIFIELLYFDYNSVNCLDFTHIPSVNYKYEGEEGPGHQLVYQYFDGVKYQTNVCYYPAYQYQSIPALLSSINLDWATTQLNHSNLSNSYDIHMTGDYNFAKDELSIKIKGSNGRLLEGPVNIPLSEVWDTKSCIFNNKRFQELQHKKQLELGVNILDTPVKRDEFIIFPRIHPSNIFSQYTYHHFIDNITANLPNIATNAGINFENSDIFEHGLLKLAGIDGALMDLCKFYPSDDASDNYFIVEFKMHEGNINQFKDMLNKLFGYGTADNHNRNKHSGTAFRIHYGIMIDDILPKWKEAVEKLLSSQSTLKAYQCLANNRVGIPSFDQICDKYKHIGSPFKLDISKSNFIVATLLKFTQVKAEEIRCAPITECGISRMSGKVCVDIFLNLPLNDVQDLIQKLNKFLPAAAAELINADVDFQNKPGKFRQISIDRDAFIGPIAEKIADTLKELQTKEPQFIATYQKQSGTYTEPYLGAAPVIKSAALDNSPVPAAASQNPNTFWAQSTATAKSTASDLQLTESEIQSAITLITGKLNSILRKEVMLLSRDNDNFLIVYLDNNRSSFDASWRTLTEKGLTVEILTGEEYGIPYLINIKHSVAQLVQKLDIDVAIIKNLAHKTREDSSPQMKPNAHLFN